MPEKRTPKAEQTRAGIVDAAMRLFRENGYDATTMRAIADEAGVSLGSAYYYFSGKEELVQAFYDQIQVEHTTIHTRIFERNHLGGSKQACLIRLHKTSIWCGAKLVCQNDQFNFLIM